jgi:hypothetical protein
MPYIKQDDRNKFNTHCDRISEEATCEGDLNYAFSRILHTYLKKKGIKYSNMNNIIGMLECCKLEMYRKIIGPYEELKITENGDVGIINDLQTKNY